MRSLNVYLGRRLIGSLEESNDLWRFRYETSWAAAEDAFDLSPSLPRSTPLHADGGSVRAVQWYFDNLLPEELLRQAISREAGIKGDDAFALLEYLGAESAGALTLLPPGRAMPEATSARALPDSSLSDRIRGLPRTTLTAGAPKRMSLAGAQHKLLIVYSRSAIFEPEGATASTHILKPNHVDPNTYPQSVCNEYLTMRLAAAAGLPVPDVFIRHVPEPVYIVERFDRKVKWLGAAENGTPELSVERLHLIDACQLLNRSRTFKHSGATLESLRQIIEHTTNKAHSRFQLFRWLVFNVLTGNDDCHLKNLSFLVSPDGIKLAPQYDLLATSAYATRAFAADKATWDAVPMAIPLTTAHTFGEVTRETIISAGAELSVPATVAERILKEVTSRVAQALPKEIQLLDKLYATLPDSARVHAAGEKRVLSVIEHIIVPEMLNRMNPARP